MAQFKSMTLIVFALMVLVIPGVLFTNLSNNGLNVSQSQALTCSTDPQTPTCQISGNVGCQSSSAYCNISGSKISFLNQNSPFTVLLSGNILGFMGGLTAAVPIQQNSYQATGLGTANIYPGVCSYTYVGNATANTNYIITGCSNTDSYGNVLPVSNTLQLQPNPYSVNRSSIPLRQLTVTNISSYPSSGSFIQSSICFFIGGIGHPGGSITDNLDGCQWYSTHSSLTSYWYFVTDLNVTLALNNHNTYGGAHDVAYCITHFGLTPGTDCKPITLPVTIQPESWDVFDCSIQIVHPSGNPNTHADLGTGGIHIYDPLPLQPISPECSSMTSSILNYNSNLGNNFGITAVMLWVGGFILLLAGLGMSFSMTGSVFGTGGGVGAGVNEQGARLAQTLGFGLIVWIPFFSEFNTWFTSGLLPVGLDGSLGIVSVVITGLFWFGLFWRMLTLD